MRKFRIEFLLSAVVEVDEDLPKDELMGQLYHALDLNKYKFNGFEVTNFRGESNVIKDEEVNDDIDEEKEHPEKPIPLAELDDDEMDQVQDIPNEPLGNKAVFHIHSFCNFIFGNNGMDL